MTADRPKTLEEARAFLLERLPEHRSPLYFTDEAAARETIANLQGLDGERWAAAWAATGERFERLAEEAEERGDGPEAAHARFQAYAFYAVGRYPCPNHPAKERCYAKARTNYLAAAGSFDPPVQPVSVPFHGRPGEDSEVLFFLRKPKGLARPPVVLVWGGIDSWKEEGHANAEPLLAEGAAVVTLDMPGTGQSPVSGLTLDAERQYTPVFEWIRSQPDLDGSRIGCLGLSFGGYWATKLAHTHRQYLAAAASWGGGAHLTFQTDWILQSRYANSYLMELLETRARMLGGSSAEYYMQHVGKLSLLDQGILDQPSAPLLLVNGKDDRQTTIEDLYLVLQHGNPKTARVFPGGHMGHTPQTRPTIVRWLLEQLRA